MLFPLSLCVCPPLRRKNDGKKEIERKKNKNVGEVEADLLGLGLQRLSCSDCGREKETEKGDFESWKRSRYIPKLPEKGDFERSEFVEGFYFFLDSNFHRLVTWIYLTKTHLSYVLFVRNKTCGSR